MHDVEEDFAYKEGNASTIFKIVNSTMTDLLALAAMMVILLITRISAKNEVFFYLSR